jgi:methionyl aminopeptidase
MVKTLEEIHYIRESCRIVAGVLEHLKGYIKPGVSTLELDRIIEDYIKSRNGVPAFKGYRVRDNIFPANSCISVNEEVVHGIPGTRKLVEGDIVSVDVGVKKDGYYGDGAKTYAVGDISVAKKKLMRIAEQSLYVGLELATDGNPVNEVSYAVQQYVESEGFSVVRDLVGHGIGRNLHEEPPVPNYYFSGNKYRFLEGMTVAIEPMVNYGTFKVKILPDKWTYVTADGEPSAHFEHSILVTRSRPEILTVLN